MYGYKLTSLLLAVLVAATSFLYNGCAGCDEDSNILPPHLYPPKSPVNVKAEAISADSIRLTWEDRAQNEEGFEIYERTASEPTFIMAVAITTPNVVSYVLTGKQPATTYTYYVKAYNQSEKSDSSNVATVTTPDVAPKSPGDLQGYLETNNTITLTWADSSLNETGFRIERNTIGVGSWATIGEVRANITQFVDYSEIAQNSVYIYRVIAFNLFGTSDPSNECVVSTEVTVRPAPPTAKYAQPVSSTRVDFAWEPTGTNHSGYKVYRKRSSEGWDNSRLFERSAGVTLLEDTALTAQTSYDYRVIAYNDKGNSDPSSVLTARTPSDASLSAPTNLKAEVVGSSLIKITWRDNTADENGFTIERKAVNGTWDAIAEARANDTLWVDTELSSRVEYFYRVTAFKASQSSPFSNEASAIPRIATPKALFATAKSATKIELRWQDNTNEELGFYLERKQGGGAWSVVKTTAENITLYLDQNLQPSTTYSYRLYSFNANDTSDAGDEVMETTKGINAPSSLTAAAKSSTVIETNWVDNSGTEETGFVLQRHSGNMNWTNINLPANSTTYRDTALTPNTTYTYRVYAVANELNSDYSNETSAATSSLATPANLTANANSSTSAILAWEDRSYDETGFKIERKVGLDAWTLVGSAGADTLAFTDRNLTPDLTYSYRVCAYHQTGQSAFSNTAVVTPVVPSPSELAISLKSSTSLQLTWVDNSIDESGFYIERRQGEGEWQQFGTSQSNVPIFIDTGLIPDSTYSYRVQAYVGGSKSNYSDPISATPFITAPTGLTAETISSTEVLLGWTDRTSDETGFKIERKDGEGLWILHDSTLADVATFTDSRLFPGTKYSYRIKAYHPKGTSRYSEEANATPILPAPTDLTANAKSSSAIEISWTDNALDETGFKIERKETGGNWSEIRTVEANVEGYQDTGLKPETEYSYKIRAYIPTGVSTYTDPAVVTTKAIPAPSNVLATPKNSTIIELIWQDNTDEEQGYKIERKTGAENWAEVKATGASATFYADSGLTPKTQYLYRIRAFHATGNSAYCDQVLATTKELPAPTNLTLTLKSSSSVELKWTDNTYEETGFKIERKSDAENWAEVDTISKDTITYLNVDLVPGTKYYYRVRAFHKTGASDYTNEANATPFLPAPTNVTATSRSGTKVELSWQDKSIDEVGFKIERKTSDNEWSETGITGANSIAYLDTGLTVLKTYTYRLRSFVATGASDYSNESSAIVVFSPSDTLIGHTSNIMNVTFSPDGSTLASGCNDKDIKIWNANDGECVRTLSGHTIQVNSVAFSPDGKTLASGSYDKSIKLWRLADGQCVQTFTDHTERVWSVDFSPDGKTLISGSDDNAIKIWRLSDGSCIKTLDDHRGWVRSVAFSSDGLTFASASWDSTVKIWRAADGVCQATLIGHREGVYTVAFSPDGQLLASGTTAGVIKIWRVADGECIQTLTEHQAFLRSVSFAPDGLHLASGSDDRTIKLWRVTDGVCIGTLRAHNGEVSSVAFSPNGKSLVSSSYDSTIILWK